MALAFASFSLAGDRRAAEAARRARAAGAGAGADRPRPRLRGDRARGARGRPGGGRAGGHGARDDERDPRRRARRSPSPKRAPASTCWSSARAATARCAGSCSATSRRSWSARCSARRSSFRAPGRIRSASRARLTPRPRRRPASLWRWGSGDRVRWPRRASRSASQPPRCSRRRGRRGGRRFRAGPDRRRRARALRREGSARLRCGRLGVPLERADPVARIAVAALRACCRAATAPGPRRARCSPSRAAPATAPSAAPAATWTCSATCSAPRPAAGRRARHGRLGRDRLPRPAARNRARGHRARRLRRAARRHLRLLPDLGRAPTTSTRSARRSATGGSCSTATPTAPTSRSRTRSGTATRVRRIVLDSAYPVRGESAWYPSTWRTGIKGRCRSPAAAPPPARPGPRSAWPGSRACCASASAASARC